MSAMGIRTIAFGMVFVLIALFVLAKLYAKKSEEKNKFDGLYAEIIFHHKNMTEFNAQTCCEEIVEKLGISPEKAKEMLINDGLITAQ